MISIAILMPVMNDWISCYKLIHNIDNLDELNNYQITIYLIDDCSTIPPPDWESELKNIKAIEYIRLIQNMGHQRAIAIGLVNLINTDHSLVVIMDADGEDSPQYICQLISIALEKNKIAVAKRMRRTESLTFRLFYKGYKSFFFIMTGHNIDFGNYCAIPTHYLSTLAHNSGLWSHLAATLVSSRLPLVKIDTNRSKRYDGRSKMSFTALVLHGLSAIAIFIETVTVRSLIIMSFICGFFILGIIVALILRFATNLAIPGWTTNIIGLFLIGIIQTVIIITILTFYILQSRSYVRIIPSREAPIYIERHLKLWSKN